MRDGEQVLDILARHPSTARFISTKLARRFVSDTPPAGLVDRLAARFTETHGDLRAVMTLLLTSPEFLAPASYRAKVKTPFEFVVSAVRATGAEIRRHADARQGGAGAGDAALPVPAADRLQGHGRCLDEHRRAGKPHELCAGASAGSPQVEGAQATFEELLAHDLSDTTRATIAKAHGARTGAGARAGLARISATLATEASRP